MSDSGAKRRVQRGASLLKISSMRVARPPTRVLLERRVKQRSSLSSWMVSRVLNRSRAWSTSCRTCSCSSRARGGHQLAAGADHDRVAYRLADPRQGTAHRRWAEVHAARGSDHAALFEKNVEGDQEIHIGKMHEVEV